MSQRMRRDVLPDAGPYCSFGDDAHDVIVIEWTTGTRRDKEPYLASFMSEQRAGFFQIKLERGDGRLGERYYTLRVAFAVLDSESSRLQVGVVDRQRAQFSATDAGGVKSLQHGPVANIAWLR